MRRLVKLGHLEPRQYEELVELLGRNDVRFREAPGGLLFSGAIMVVDEDLEKAKEILRAHSEAYAVEARKRWQEEWRTEHGGSTLKWFVHRLREQPLEVVLRLLLLALAVGAFVLFPLWYVMRSAI